jgi:hypothetical protein
MKAITTSAAIVALIGLIMSAVPLAESPVLLTVRLYNSAGIPVPELLAARHAAESVLRDTGLTVSFRNCGQGVPSSQPLDSCHERPSSREVVVRVIDAPAFNTTLPSEAFGVAYVVKDTGRGWLATVFADRIAVAAVRAHVDTGALLGFVMAHEVGHLLLGIDYHSETGVMRADWPDPLLHRRPEQWRFSKLEAAKIRQAASTAF